ncbi:MAG: PQQ-dependent sugar dehydrogenase [Phycisphaerales bacterium]|nr:PQQ-dependent sugar dehydrogenase [Phycisphaerales bacterium]
MHARSGRRVRQTIVALVAPILAPALAAMQCVVRDRSETPSTSSVGLQMIAEGFVSPVGIAFPNDGTGRRFVVDQIGVIHVVNSAGTVLTTPLLDLRDRMASLNARDERGLLSMALHPEFTVNGLFYVCYNGPRDAGDPSGFNSELRISAFEISDSDANVADATSEEVLLDINKPASNHNGGQLAFGPDGMLYVSVGDGGGSGLVGDDGAIDGGTSQSLSTPLGKILRVNVNLGAPFNIPADNPFFAVAGARGEIWALGFRNPWRFSFDMGGDHRMFVGDVGQNLYEEIDIVEAGGNYGWIIREGAHCYDAASKNDPPASCDNMDARGAALIDPIIEQPQVDENGDAVGISIIGGYVYRGDGVPELGGDYVFGQWTSQGLAVDGRLFAATENSDSTWTTRELSISGTTDSRLGRYVLAFGQDADGEIYVLSSSESGLSGTSGRVDKLVISP